jgi:hypothetical protein
MLFQGNPIHGRHSHTIPLYYLLDFLSYVMAMFIFNGSGTLYAIPYFIHWLSKNNITWNAPDFPSTIFPANITYGLIYLFGINSSFGWSFNSCCHFSWIKYLAINSGNIISNIIGMLCYVLYAFLPRTITSITTDFQPSSVYQYKYHLHAD